MNEGLRWTWICIVWMYSRSRLTRYWVCTSPISQFWTCEIAKWNCQLSHLPAPQHERPAVSLLPRHKHWDYHRIARRNHRRFFCNGRGYLTPNAPPRACTWRTEGSDFLIVNNQVRGISSKLRHVPLLSRVPCQHIHKTRYAQKRVSLVNQNSVPSETMFKRTK